MKNSTQQPFKQKWTTLKKKWTGSIDKGRQVHSAKNVNYSVTGINIHVLLKLKDIYSKFRRNFRLANSVKRYICDV